MSIQKVPNNMGWQMNYGGNILSSSYQGQTLDAVGESVCFIGKVFLEAGLGSKLISSAGGKITWFSGNASIVNVATVLRIGIQDPELVNGKEDGTYDVYGEYTSAGAPTNNTVITKAMSSGSKTISHGQDICVIIEMTAKGGVDYAEVNGMTPAYIVGQDQRFPYATIDSGFGPQKTQNFGYGVTIQFDDGSLGWLEPGFVFPDILFGTSFTYNDTSSPDEYGMAIRLPFESSIRSAWLSIGSINLGDTFDIVVYSDPFGVPNPERTMTIDSIFSGSSFSFGAPYWVPFLSKEFAANEYFGIVLKPTSANNLNLGYHNLGVGNEHFKRILPFGSDFKMIGRTNGSGAFVETQTYHLPMGGILLDGFSDGAGGGGQPFGTF